VNHYSQANQRSVRRFRAKYVFSGVGDPIPNGLIEVDGRLIRDVRPAQDEEACLDLGDVAIVPGLINAHTHLEFSRLSSPIGQPGISFTNWVSRVIEWRLETNFEPAKSTTSGLRESFESGTTVLCDIVQPNWPRASFEKTPIDATAFLELIGPTRAQIGDVVDLAKGHISKSTKSSCLHLGLSPHAPYSIHPEALSAIVSLSASESIPLSFHLAESRAELEFMRSGNGPIRTLLEQLGVWNDQLLEPDTRPLDFLRILSNAHRTLIVHGNYCDDKEIDFIADHSGKMAVVFCPRSHAWFDYDRYPLDQFLSSGVVVAIGTDSLASSPTLSILDELRFVAKQYPHISGDTILRMGTINAARALGRHTELGSLERGKIANFVTVGLPEGVRQTADPYQLLFDSTETTLATFVA